MSPSVPSRPNVSPHREDFEKRFPKWLEREVRRTVEEVRRDEYPDRTIGVTRLENVPRAPFESADAIREEGSLLSRWRLELELREGGKAHEPRLLTLLQTPTFAPAGTLVIDGLERVPVAQLRIAPGLYVARGSQSPRILLCPEEGPFVSIEQRRLRSALTLETFVTWRGERAPREAVLRAIWPRWNGGSGAAWGGAATSLDPSEERFWRRFLLTRPGDLGRTRIEARLGTLPIASTISRGTGPDWTPEDFLAVESVFAAPEGTEIGLDDLADLANRRVFRFADLAREAVRPGLRVLAAALGEELARKKPDLVTAVAQARQVLQRSMDRLVRGPLCPPLDGLNALSRVVQKRMVTFCGPGGVEKRWAAAGLRDVHPSHYGRLCVLETTESERIGLKLFLASEAGIDDDGFLLAPFVRTSSKRRVWLTAVDEREKGDRSFTEKAPVQSAAAQRVVSGKKANVPLRRGADFLRGKAPDAAFGDAARSQCLGLSASLVPFVHHDDPNRAMMGAKNLKQALPLLRPETPLVSTGFEEGISRLDGSGVLQLGTNLLVAYLPYFGYNFEDGIVLSDRCVREDLLTSVHEEHLRYEVHDDEDVVTLAKKGDQLQEGSVLLETKTWTGRVRKELAQANQQGEVTAVEVDERPRPVAKDPDARHVRAVVRISIRRLARVRVGDKLTGRHGNKGVVTRIVPETEMPRIEGGFPVDVLLNPHGVVSRKNLGQLFETHAALAARLLGCHLVSAPFERLWLASPGRTKAGKEVEKALSDAPSDLEAIRSLIALAKSRGTFWLDADGKAALFDPVAGKPIEQPIAVGFQYLVKLNHLPDLKVHSRGEGPYQPVSQQATRGKRRDGGQRAGEMEVWALEAHDVPDLLQELLTLKADDLQGRRGLAGAAKARGPKSPGLPETLRVVAFLLEAMNVRLELVLQSGKVVAATNAGVAPDDVVSLMLRQIEGDAEPPPGPRVTAHAVVRQELRDVFACDCGKSSDVGGGAAACPKCSSSAYRRGVAIEKSYVGGGIQSVELFGQLESDERRRKGAWIELAEEVLSPFEPESAPAGDLAWEMVDIRADEDGPWEQKHWSAYVDRTDLHAKPCRGGLARAEARRAEASDLAEPAPKKLRFLFVPPADLRPWLLRGAGDFVSDLNVLYQSVVWCNAALRKAKAEAEEEERRTGKKSPTLEHRVTKARRRLQLAVNAVFFGQSRPRTLRGLRSLLDGKLGLLRLGLLGKRVNYSARGVIVADPELDLDQCRLPRRMLEGLAPPRYRGEEGPVVLLNRAPSLHRYNVLAFEALSRADDESVIGLHPLVCGMFAADFDGDTIAVHLPVLPASVEDARRCFPSSHLWSIATGRLNLHLVQDLVSGAYVGASSAEGVDELGKILGRAFTSPPKKPDLVRAVDELLRHKGPNALADVRQLMNWAFAKATSAGLTVGLFDVDALSVPPTSGEAGIPARLDEALTQVPPNPVSILVLSGARGDVATVGELASGRSVGGPKGRKLTASTTPSFLEGLGPFDLFKSGFDARKAMVEKKISVALAGDLTRWLVEAAYPIVVTAEDCEGAKGVALTREPGVEGPKRTFAERLRGRVAAENVKDEAGILLRKGDVIDPATAAKILDAGVESVLVRSAIHCKEKRGICQRCYGWDLSRDEFPAVGLPVGLIAAQSIGERGTQLTMQTIHGAGAAAVTHALPAVRALLDKRRDESACAKQYEPDVKELVQKLRNSYRLDVDDRHFEVAVRSISVPLPGGGWRIAGLREAVQARAGFLARASGFGSATDVLLRAADTPEGAVDRLESNKERLMIGARVRR